MLIRFTMFPMEVDLLPIYERLLAGDERAAARVLRALLHRHDSPGMPTWFEEMPRKAFPSPRARTIRLNITAFDPALASLKATLEPMSGTERVTALKTALLQLVKPKPIPAQTDTPTQSPQTGFALVPPTQFRLDAPKDERRPRTPEDLKKMRRKATATFAD